MANNRGAKRKVTDSYTDEEHTKAPALRRRLIDPSGLLDHCFAHEPRFGAFLPDQSTHGIIEKSSTPSQRRKLRLPDKLGRPALLNHGKGNPLAPASSAAAQDVLDWDTPEFAEEPGTTCLHAAAAVGAETNVDLPAKEAGLPSSTPAMSATADSSPVLAETLGHCALLGNNLSTPPSAAAAEQPASIMPAADAPSLNPASCLAAAAPTVPEQKVSNTGEAVQSFAFGKPLSIDGLLSSGGSGQPSGNNPLAAFGAPQQSGEAALQTQNASQQTMPPGPLFGQMQPDQAPGFAAGAAQAQPRRMVRAKRFSRR